MLFYWEEVSICEEQELKVSVMAVQHRSGGSDCVVWHLKGVMGPCW